MAKIGELNKEFGEEELIKQLSDPEKDIVNRAIDDLSRHANTRYSGKIDNSGPDVTESQNAILENMKLFVNAHFN